MTFLLVALAGASGAVIRAAISHGLNQRIALGTLVANVVACFALGFLNHWDGLGNFHWPTSVAVQVGLLGSLSTWSSLSHDVASLLRSDRAKDAGLTIALNLGLGICAAWAGIRLGI